LKQITDAQVNVEERRPENLHGWRTVKPDTKSTLLGLFKMLHSEVEITPASTCVVEEEVEYDGYGDEFFFQDN